MRAVVFVSTECNPENEKLIDQGRFYHISDMEIPNDFDLIAVEAAVRLKENGALDEVVVFGIGPSTQGLMKALAMGADRAYYSPSKYEELCPETVVSTIQNMTSIDEPDEIWGQRDTIWMLGKIGVNFELGLTAPLLARELRCPCFHAVCGIEHRDSSQNVGVDKDRRQRDWHLICESEGGKLHYYPDPPFVLTSDLRLAEPRFPSLTQIVKARHKPFVTIPIVSDSPVISGATLWLEPAEDSQRKCEFLQMDAFINHIREVR